MIWQAFSRRQLKKSDRLTLDTFPTQNPAADYYLGPQLIAFRHPEQLGNRQRDNGLAAIDMVTVMYIAASFGGHTEMVSF